MHLHNSDKMNTILNYISENNENQKLHDSTLSRRRGPHRKDWGVCLPRGIPLRLRNDCERGIRQDGRHRLLYVRKGA